MQAEDMDLPIHWHWQTSFEGADLQARTALFSRHGEDDGPLQQPYDLLVGADGGWSRVRREAEAQVAGLTATAQPSLARYKVFTGLPPSNGLTADTLRVLPAAGKAGRKHRALAFLVTDPASSATRGMLSMDADGWQELQGAQCCRRFLREEFPALPGEWLPEVGRRAGLGGLSFRMRSPLLCDPPPDEKLQCTCKAWCPCTTDRPAALLLPTCLQMASQLAVNPQVAAGTRVSVTQLHGPALVLLGDAGHSITPRTGHGFNAALEDAWTLAQVRALVWGVASAPKAVERRRRA